MNTMYTRYMRYMSYTRYMRYMSCMRFLIVRHLTFSRDKKTCIKKAHVHELILGQGTYFCIDIVQM